MALAVDLVPEYDGDESFPKALGRLVDHTDKPVAVLSHLASAIDEPLAADLRARGIPVLEGTRSGLRALGHLLDHATPPVRPDPVADEERRARWSARLRAGEVDAFALLADYGIPVVTTATADDPEAAVAAADAAGYPVVLKTADPDIHHKLDVDGVRLRLGDSDAVAAAYADLAARLGPTVSVQPEVPEGVEVALGLWRDPLLGTARPGRGRRLAGRAAGRAVGRAAAGGRRHRARAWCPGCACRSCSPATAAVRRSTPTAWSPRSWRSRSWPTSSATCSRRSTSTRWSSARPASWRSTYWWCPR